MRTAIYHRVSTLDQDPTLARDELRAAAKARGLDVVMEVEETGSGARNSRPGWQRVLDAARRNRIQVVLCWKLDRASRSALDLLTNVEELGRCGVRFICTSQGIDIQPSGDPMSRLLLTMLSAVSEFERALIMERTRLAINQARKRGRRLGRPPTKVIPSFTAVDDLRSAGKSWSVIASALGCSATTASRVHQKGPAIQLQEVAEIKAAA